jgi:hypothetical protein
MSTDNTQMNTPKPIPHSHPLFGYMSKEHGLTLTDSELHEIERIARGLFASDAGGAELITEERQRQISQEGWTPEHDDGHDGSEMLRAAVCYVNCASLQSTHCIQPEGVPGLWPWESSQWNPSPDPVRNLVIAGALIAAEIDRLQRQSK